MVISNVPSSSLSVSPDGADSEELSDEDSEGSGDSEDSDEELAPESLEGLASPDVSLLQAATERASAALVASVGASTSE